MDIDSNLPISGGCVQVAEVEIIHGMWEGGWNKRKLALLKSMLVHVEYKQITDHLHGGGKNFINASVRAFF